MDSINVKKMGLAVGLTFALLHLGCVSVMLFTSHETTVAFFNSLLHGLDVTTILRHNMSGLEMTYGLIQIFVLGWLAGAMIASIYNFHFIRFDNKTKPMNMNV
ncbi:MAG: DUF5676 family membrane protein [Candidatus Omnitrophota bacterium]|nr:DUF5676 family membrane protein [Candidatus Omnitrophota bacterium]